MGGSQPMSQYRPSTSLRVWIHPARMRRWKSCRLYRVRLLCVKRLRSRSLGACSAGRGHVWPDTNGESVSEMAVGTAVEAIDGRRISNERPFRDGVLFESSARSGSTALARAAHRLSQQNPTSPTRSTSRWGNGSLSTVKCRR